MRSSEARVLSRMLRDGLLLAVLGQIAWSFRPASTQAQTDQLREGQHLYEAGCSTCHGLDAQGTQNGPSLQAVGAASLDFMLSTGRMPLNNPGTQPVRQEVKFTREQMDAIIAYVQSIAPGGPAIPVVDTGLGDLPTGAGLFLANCSGCHGAGGTGDSVGGGQIAPSLYEADPTQIAEAIRVGPGVMPRFSERTLSAHDVNSLAAYLLWVRDNGDEGGLQLGRVGAVAEGLVAAVVGLGFMILVIRLTGSKP